MFNQLVNQLINTSIFEWIAFVLSILYLIFATKELIYCWLFAIISSGIYIFLFFKANLYIDSALQFFYIIMAFVGWINWKKKENVKLTNLSLKSHLFLILLNSLFACGLAYLFDNYTDQAYPYIDSFIFCYSISATYLTTIKVVENWIYFIIIDIIAIFIYWQRDLNLTAVLFFVYTVLALIAFLKWKKQLKANIL
jgi:nicotinamide mononucleotide transporter